MSAEQLFNRTTAEDEALLLDFEKAWQGDAPPDWFDFYKSNCSPERKLSLQSFVELAAIDLELCWKRGIHRYVETYLERVPELLVEACLLELIAEEYRGRLRFQKDFARDYQKRFPGMLSSIEERLRSVDVELASEKNSDNRRMSNELPSAPSTRREHSHTADFTDRDFLLERFIGSGAVGKVYRARQLSTQSTVAIKYLKKSFQHQPMLVERFLNEAAIVRELKHPRIVRQLGLGQTKQGGYFVVLNWYQAGDLGQRLIVELPNVSDAVRWTQDAALAIDHAHAHQVVHCDLKPSNLLLDDAGNAVIADFGLARSIENIHRERTILEGTVGFMAPEQACASLGNIGPWTDIYGLGAVLYTLITGKPPYCERRPSESLSKLLAGIPFLAPTILRRDIPEEVESICLECLSRDPANRPSTAQEVARRLAAVQRL